MVRRCRAGSNASANESSERHRGKRSGAPPKVKAIMGKPRQRQQKSLQHDIMLATGDGECPVKKEFVRRFRAGVQSVGESMTRLVRLLMIIAPALLLTVTGVFAALQPVTSGDTTQGWTEENRVAWYTASQGSRLIPREWLDNLEQPDGTGMFLDPAHIKTFRYLPNPATGWKDDECPFDLSLPLGFTVDCQSDKGLSGRLRWKAAQSDREAWVGMNCAACHTAEMTFKGTTFRADGGPALANFQSLIATLNLALHNTLSDADKFERFAQQGPRNKAPPDDRDALKAAMTKWTDWNDKLAALNDPNYRDPAARIPRYGFGRLDAIGHIYNKIALLATPNSISHQVANSVGRTDQLSVPLECAATRSRGMEWDRRELRCRRRALWRAWPQHR